MKKAYSNKGVFLLSTWKLRGSEHIPNKNISLHIELTEIYTRKNQFEPKPSVDKFEYSLISTVYLSRNEEVIPCVKGLAELQSKSLPGHNGAFMFYKLVMIVLGQQIVIQFESSLKRCCEHRSQ